MFRDYRLFFREYLRDFHSTGAVSPSSRWLAAALVRYVPARTGPRRVLEVGPGTGAVTRRIVSLLGPHDALDLVEVNCRFVERLRRRFEIEPAFAARAERTRILHQPVEELPRGAPYDAVISGLPLNNFAVAEAERVLEALVGLLAPQGTLSFFEYIGVRPARALVGGQAERRRLRAIERTLGDLLERHEFRREWIWPNLPPAWVHHMRLQRGARAARRPGRPVFR